MNIKIISAYDFPQEVGELFQEYTDMLIAGDGTFQKYLDIQHYNEEIQHLDTKYGLPFLQSAIHMYKKYGFYEIESYNDSPMSTSIYMKLDL